MLNKIKHEFSYSEAFSRTLGWMTAEEQQKLRASRVAIVGLGGVGGAHAITLARLGVGKFRICDFDTFDLANFNRQFGSGMSTLGHPKADIIAEQIRDINPEAEIDLKSAPLKVEEAGKFLDDADIYIDSIDFFVLDVRRALFAAARSKGIPALTAAPIGTGSAWIIFDPEGMSFEEYFGFENVETDLNYLRFAIGLAPKGLHFPYLVDPSRFDFANRKAPSTPMGIMLCAGVATTETMKLLLGRGGIKPAPWFHQFDASAGRKVTGKLWFGARNPLQKMKLRMAARKFLTTD